MSIGTAAGALAPAALPAPWRPTYVGGGQWFVTRADVPGLREHCPRGEREARGRAASLNREAAAQAVAAQVTKVADAAVQWLERRDDGEWYTCPDDGLADEARLLRQLRELYDRTYSVDFVP